MVRASFRRVFGLCMCIGPVGVASADLLPVSQERSVMAQAAAGTPAGESHSASDFGPFNQGANAMSSASPPLEPNNASSSGGAQQDSQIGATLVTVSGSASAGATSLVGTSSASALSHFKLVFTLASPQRVTLDGEFFNESPTLGGNSPYLTDGQGSAGVSLSSAAGGDPLYATGSGPPIPSRSPPTTPRCSPPASTS